MMYKYKYKYKFCKDVNMLETRINKKYMFPSTKIKNLTYFL